MHIISIVSIFIAFAFSTVAMEHEDAPQVLKQVCKGVWTTEVSHTEAGESFHLGLEQVNAVEGWQRYKRHVACMVGNRGIMIKLANRLPQKSPYPNVEQTGFTESEYQQYVEMLSQKGFNGSADKEIIAYLSNPEGPQPANMEYGSPKTRALQNVFWATDGLDISNGGNTYVAYVSTEPVTGYFQFEHASDSITIKEFNGVYKRLIMCVALHDMPGPIFRNRAIHRTPPNVVDGTYKKISPDLFRFCRAFASQFLHGKQFQMVHPLQEQRYLLKRTYAPGRMFIGYNGNTVEGYPYIIHAEGAGAASRAILMKEGVYPNEYNSSAPQADNIQYVYTDGRSILKSNGFGEIPHLIRIETPHE